MPAMAPCKATSGYPCCRRAAAGVRSIRARDEARGQNDRYDQTGEQVRGRCQDRPCHSGQNMVARDGGALRSSTKLALLAASWGKRDCWRRRLRSAPFSWEDGCGPQTIIHRCLGARQLCHWSQHPVADRNDGATFFRSRCLHWGDRTVDQSWRRRCVRVAAFGGLDHEPRRPPRIVEPDPALARGRAYSFGVCAKLLDASDAAACHARLCGGLYAACRRYRGAVGQRGRTGFSHRIGVAGVGGGDSGWIAVDFRYCAANRLAGHLWPGWHSRRHWLARASRWAAEETQEQAGHFCHLAGGRPQSAAVCCCCSSPACWPPGSWW